MIYKIKYQILKNKQIPFWFLTCSILVGLTVPILIQDGMFMDAMLYTCVSHNLSMGIGTFWFPQFSVHNLGGFSSFHEQPPLVFGIQALFYKFLGDSLYVERFYTFLTMCIAALLIVLLWREVYQDNKNIRKIAWLPLILWITIPICFWSYSNNMHENTMSIFTLGSVFISYKAFRLKHYSTFLFVLSGFFVFLASFSKGLPGLFPVITPILYFIVTKEINFSRALFQTFVIISVPILIYLVLYFIPESRESLSNYLHRAFYRINKMPTVDSRYYILGRLFMELIPQLIFVMVFVWISKLKKVELLSTKNFRHFLFFIFVGLSGSIPLMLTLIQKGFYLVPSLPFFAIGLSILVSPIISYFVEQIKIETKKYRLFLVVSFLLLIGIVIIAFMQKGKISRNNELIHDIYLIGDVVPRKSIVSIPEKMWNDWDLQCCLIRYFNISVEPGYKNIYCILDRNMGIILPKNYQKVNISTLRYDLYKQK